MKKLFLLAAVVSAASALPATPVMAAAPAASALEKFGTCAVKQYEGAELLATQPGSSEEAEVFAEFARRSCPAPANQSEVLRGAVAEQLFKADFTAIGSRPKRETLEVFTLDAEEVEAMDAVSRRRLELLGFGTCVATADPVKAVALLNAGAGSAEEARIVAELQPHFAPCLLQGEKLNVQKADLRNALAEGAYRLAIAHSHQGDIVVTATKDPSRSVVCKTRARAGSHLGQKLCMTAAQWTTQERENEISAEYAARKAREAEEQRQTVQTRTQFPTGN